MPTSVYVARTASLPRSAHASKDRTTIIDVGHTLRAPSYPPSRASLRRDVRRTRRPSHSHHHLCARCMPIPLPAPDACGSSSPAPMYAHEKRRVRGHGERSLPAPSPPALGAVPRGKGAAAAAADAKGFLSRDRARGTPEAEID
jgi:hypothetical protein